MMGGNLFYSYLYVIIKYNYKKHENYLIVFLLNSQLKSWRKKDHGIK